MNHRVSPGIEPLTKEQLEAVEELKKRVIHDLHPEHHKDETFFYRFLKARDFNVKNAEAMIRKHLSDIKVYALDILDGTYVQPRDMNEHFPVSFIGYDKEGCVVRHMHLGGADHKGVVALYTFKQLAQFNLNWIFEDTKLNRQQSEKLGKSITKSIYIWNMEGFDLFKATNKKSIQYLFDGFKLYQDNLPERMKYSFFINTTYYSQMAFTILKASLGSEVIQKMRVYGKTGWKEALLEEIDADVLPAFLGGTRTDPDGNPMCYSFMYHGKIIPEELYMKKNKTTICNEKGVKKLIVSRFSSSEIMIDVKEPDTNIEWEFESKTRDIGFGLYYTDNLSPTSRRKVIIPKQRIDTIFSSETGCYKCDKKGTYIIVFDNSYSWFYSKEIYYRFRLVPPER